MGQHCSGADADEDGNDHNRGANEQAQDRSPLPLMAGWDRVRRRRPGDVSHVSNPLAEPLSANTAAQLRGRSQVKVRPSPSCCGKRSALCGAGVTRSSQSAGEPACDPACQG